MKDRWQRGRWPRLGRPAALLTLITLAVALSVAHRVESAAAAVACDRWASSTGVDTNPGTQAQPVRSIAKLIELLSAPAQANARNGCLVAGETFIEPIGTFIIGARGGTSGDPVVIQSSGTPRASVRAQAWLQEASHDITFTELNFVGTPNDVGASMLIIDGDRIVFRNNDISYVNGICVDVGNMDGQGGAVGNPADGFVLDRNRIHNCGTSRPMNDLGTSGLHGVYIQNTNDAVVTNNVIFDNMNRGLQLFPLAQRTLVEFNVLDGNSSNLNIGGYQPENRFSDNNVARNNIITNALLKTYFVPGWPVTGDISSVVGNFPQERPVTNSVTGNCLWYDDPNLRQPHYYYDGFGIDFSNNTFSDPLYVNRAGKDFRLQPGSPCADKGPRPDASTCNGSAATITGTAGNDFLTGTAAADVIVGLSGNDSISGLGGNDKICAGDGDDIVAPGAGDDAGVDAGAGVDTISYSDTGSGANINLTNGDMFHPGGDPEYDTFTGFENAIGGFFGDLLIGSGMDNRLDGGSGNDVIHGYPGHDVLLGGLGLDELHGWEGDDMIFARDGVGAEQIGCGEGSDSVVKDASDVSAADCESVRLAPPVADFDGDGDTDVSVWRPSNGTWYAFGGLTQQWGVSSDVPVPGQYDGDVATDVAAWRPSNGTWYVQGGATQQWGISTDVPVPGDYDGDGDSEFAVWRPQGGTWYVFGGATQQWGSSGDVPVPGDYDGDGDTDMAVWRPSNGDWYVFGGATQQWGVSTDVPVPGQYDADPATEIAVWRPSNGTWYVFGGATQQWGISTDVPVPGDYDGDGDTEFAAWRPSSGIWYVHGGATQQWGSSGDKPLPPLPSVARLLFP